MQNITNALSAGLNVYESTIAEQVFSKNVLFQNILKNVATKKGTNKKYLKVHSQRNVGSAAGSDTMTLPSAGNQGITEATIDMKINVHQIGITDFALQAGKNSKEFLVDLLQSEYDGAKADMQRQLSRQGYSTGTGELFLVAGDPGTGTTFNVDTPMVGKNPTDYIEVGNILRFGATASQIQTVASITDGDTFETNTIAAGIADNDAAYIARSTTESNKDAEIIGLKALIDDETEFNANLQNIDRTTSIWWKSYVNTAVADRSLTEEIMFDTFLEAKKKGEPKYILTSFDLYSAYGRLLSADRRYTADMTLNGGFTGVSFNGIALVPDYDCPYKTMFFIDPTSLSVEEMAPMSFMQEDGAILSRSATTPAYNATLRYYANLAISAPNKSAKAIKLVA